MYFVSALKALTQRSQVSEKQHEAVDADSSDLPATVGEHDFCHSGLFLLRLSMSLQSRHPCFQSGDPVDEMLVLLLCQTHSCHGCNHNYSSRKVQGSGCSRTTMR